MATLFEVIAAHGPKLWDAQHPDDPLELAR